MHTIAQHANDRHEYCCHNRALRTVPTLCMIPLQMILSREDYNKNKFERLRGHGAKIVIIQCSIADMTICKQGLLSVVVPSSSSSSPLPAIVAGFNRFDRCTIPKKNQKKFEKKTHEHLKINIYIYIYTYIQSAVLDYEN